MGWPPKEVLSSLPPGGIPAATLPRGVANARRVWRLAGCRRAWAVPTLVFLSSPPGRPPLMSRIPPAADSSRWDRHPHLRERPLLGILPAAARGSSPCAERRPSALQAADCGSNSSHCLTQTGTLRAVPLGGITPRPRRSGSEERQRRCPRRRVDREAPRSPSSCSISTMYTRWVFDHTFHSSLFAVPP